MVCSIFPPNVTRVSESHSMKRPIIFLIIGLLAGPVINIFLNRPIDYVLGVRPYYQPYYHNPEVRWDVFTIKRNFQNGDPWANIISEFRLFPIENSLRLNAYDFSHVCMERKEYSYSGVSIFDHRFLTDKRPDHFTFKFQLTDDGKNRVENFIRTFGDNVYALANHDLILTVEFSGPYIFDLDAQGFHSNWQTLTIESDLNHSHRLLELASAMNDHGTTPICDGQSS